LDYPALPTPFNFSRTTAINRSRAVKRAIQSGLMRPALGAEVNPQPIAAAVLEFLAHAHAAVAEIWSPSYTDSREPSLAVGRKTCEVMLPAWTHAGLTCRSRRVLSFIPPPHTDP
jgi:hypothetical protein